MSKIKIKMFMMMKMVMTKMPSKMQALAKKIILIMMKKMTLPKFPTVPALFRMKSPKMMSCFQILTTGMKADPRFLPSMDEL